MRYFIIIFVFALSSIANAQDTNSSWWESYNKKNTETPVTPKNSRSFFATKIQVGLNIDWLSGDAGDGFDPGIGYNLGISEDFWNNGPLGFETGLYYTQYNLSFGSGNDHNFKVKMHYIEWQLMMNPRLFIDNSSIELNLGLGIDLGLSAPVKYKSEDLDYDLFVGTKKRKAQLKDSSGCFLYGLTYRWSDGYLRMLAHHGITNISNVDSSEKAYLWNFEFSLGFIF